MPDTAKYPIRVSSDELRIIRRESQRRGTNIATTLGNMLVDQAYRALNTPDLVDYNYENQAEVHSSVFVTLQREQWEDIMHAVLVSNIDVKPDDISTILYEQFSALAISQPQYSDDVAEWQGITENCRHGSVC
jgi:hypothetical protein